MNIPVTRAAEGLDRRAFTIADMQRMVEAGILAPSERLELVGGEIVPMSPKGSRHETVKVAIVRLWGNRCPPNFVFAPETALHLDGLNYLEPDLLVFERLVRLANVKGPDVRLAVEIADSSLHYDLHRKSQVYASFGVQELWVIDAARRVVHTHTAPVRGAYTKVDRRDAAHRLVPACAPAELAFALDELDEV